MAYSWTISGTGVIYKAPGDYWQAAAGSLEPQLYPGPSHTKTGFQRDPCQGFLHSSRFHDQWPKGQSDPQYRH